MAESPTELLLGEIKGRLDTYIALAEAERAVNRRTLEDHEERIVSLESDLATARTLGSFLRWAVGGLAIAFGWLASHVVWSFK